MKRYVVTALVFIGVGLLIYLRTDDAAAQRRRTSVPSKPATQNRAAKDYSRFSHATKEHKEACKSCHLVPTANAIKVRGFPDVADFPNHDACVRCHRNEFFKGAQPAICTDCHTRSGPRGVERWEFRNPKHERQFTIEFPHDKHQDVIASLRGLSFHQIIKAAHVVDEHTRKYNNCTICHARPRPPIVPATGWIDGFVPPSDTFKSEPTGHDMCFNCHWQGQAPVRENCEGCHKLAATAYAPLGSPRRISMKFRHDGGGPKQNHVAECTSCHINITKSRSLQSLNLDVPITACTECHNKEGLRQDLNKEFAAIDKDKNYVCNYCHTSDVGKRDAPLSHFSVAERTAFKRADLK